jgi:hypothetical protein
MSEYIFGVTSKRHNSRAVERLDAICRGEGGHGFTRYSAPGSSVKGWFTGRNYGEPFNSALARRVLNAVKAAGIDL